MTVQVLACGLCSAVPPEPACRDAQVTNAGVEIMLGAGDVLRFNHNEPNYGIHQLGLTERSPAIARSDYSSGLSPEDATEKITADIT